MWLCLSLRVPLVVGGFKGDQKQKHLGHPSYFVGIAIKQSFRSHVMPRTASETMKAGLKLENLLPSRVNQ